MTATNSPGSTVRSRPRKTCPRPCAELNTRCSPLIWSDIGTSAFDCDHAAELHEHCVEGQADYPDEHDCGRDAGQIRCVIGIPDVEADTDSAGKHLDGDDDHPRNT